MALQERMEQAPQLRNCHFDRRLAERAGCCLPISWSGSRRWFFSSPRHRLSDQLPRGLSALKSVHRGMKSRSGPKVAVLSFGSKQIVNGETLSRRSKAATRSLISLLGRYVLAQTSIVANQPLLTRGKLLGIWRLSARAIIQFSRSPRSPFSMSS